MNLAQVRSELYEYSACAMPLFDAMLLQFQTKKRVYKYVPRKQPVRTEPRLKLDWQQAIWNAMGKSKRALQTTEIYELIPARFSKTREQRQRIRMILLSWLRGGWIRKSGVERQYRYVRVK